LNPVLCNGEDGETPLAAAQREGWEEARIPLDATYMPLDTRCSIPVYHFHDHPLWGAQTYVIPEYSFAVDAGEQQIVLSPEHRESRWLHYEEAIRCLTFDSNKTALWELQQRLLRQDLPHQQVNHG
jgi:dihydroneopterin triphosphate diphosphatase